MINNYVKIILAPKLQRTILIRKCKFRAKQKSNTHLNLKSNFGRTAAGLDVMGDGVAALGIQCSGLASFAK